MRKPLRGAVRVGVVLVDFADRAMTPTPAHFRDLFFSTRRAAARQRAGVLPRGDGRARSTSSARWSDRSACRTTLAWYANGNFGIGEPSGDPRANIMAQDAAKAADPLIDFTPYDNDGNGYVDAFVVVHAGGGGEETGRHGDIWSHKWTLPAAADRVDGTSVYAYLTMPEDAASASAPTSSVTCCSAARICTTPTTRRRASATGA